MGRETRAFISDCASVALRPPRLAALLQFAVKLKLHRITPLGHILDFFTLINLVNQFRRVIDQPHGCFTRHTGTAQAVAGNPIVWFVLAHFRWRVFRRPTLLC